MTSTMLFRWQAPWLSGDNWILICVDEEGAYLECADDSRICAIAGQCLNAEACEDLATQLRHAAAILRDAARRPE